LSQEGSGSRDPKKDSMLKMTNSQIFKPGKVNWKNFAAADSIDDITPRTESYRTAANPKGFGVTAKLR